MKFIINADDFGLRPSINESIAGLMESGLVTSATIMVKRNKDALREALAYTRAMAGRAGFGLHLDLDEYFAFDETGRYGKDEYDIPDNYRSIIKDKKGAIVQDIAGQMDHLIQAGLKLSHVDGHHFVHQFDEVLPLVLCAMKERGIRAMRLNPLFYRTGETLGKARELIALSGVSTPHAFCDVWELDFTGPIPFYRQKQEGGHSGETDAITPYPAKSPDSMVTEIMVHTEKQSPQAPPWTVQQHDFLLEKAQAIRRLELVDFRYLHETL